MLMVKHIRHEVIYEDLAQFCHLAGEFVTDAFANIVLCTSGIKDFVYERAEGELINRIFNATSA